MAPAVLFVLCLDYVTISPFITLKNKKQVKEILLLKGEFLILN